MFALSEVPTFEESLPLPYWTAFYEAAADEAHPKLLRAVADRSGIRFCTAGIYDSFGVPSGIIDLAVDPAYGEACGVYMFGFNEDTGCTDVIWVPMEGDVDMAIQRVVNAVLAIGML